MRPIFHVTRTDTPHVVLFSAGTLAAIAECVAAQPDPAALAVYAGGEFTRELTAHEPRRLDELLREAEVGR